MHCVYFIKNTVSGKVYVGQTARVSKRWSNHRSALSNNLGNAALRADWKRDGRGAFQFLRIGVFENKTEADSAEEMYIGLYSDLGLCYNVQPGAWGPVSRSPETREKIRQANARNGNRPPSQAGVSPSPETREKLRQACLRNGNRPPGWAGGHHTEESKAKIAASKLGKPGAMRGKRHSEETKAKMRVAALTRIAAGHPVFGRK